MAENQEDRSQEDLTEEASPYRLEEYRRKGIVAQSRELSGLAALLATGIATYSLFVKFAVEISEFTREVFRTDLSSKLDLGSAKTAHGYFVKAIEIMFSIGGPICGIGFIAGILGSYVQIGSIFSFEPLTPDLDKLNPIQGLQKMISMKQFYDGLRLMFKMIVVLAVSFYLLKSEILAAPTHFGGDADDLLIAFCQSAKVIFLSLVGVFGVFAAIDYGFQKYEYSKNLRMTKQEAKQEHKEREGNPQMRARIRSVQREMARRRMMQAVKSADVIVTNPTHIAVALVYDTQSMSAPRVVAKGADFVAQKIKEVAAAAGVPLVENVPLARTLYKTVKINQSIPRALYQAVAEVLAFVYRLRKKDL